MRAVFERRNWLIHTNPAPYQPRSEAWHRITSDDVQTLVVRSERQTLRRLDARSVVFTIRVTSRPAQRNRWHSPKRPTIY